MSPIDTAIRSGALFVKAHVVVLLSKGVGRDIMKAYVAGIIQGAAYWLAETYGEKEVFKLLTDAAEEIIAPKLMKGK